MTRFKLFFFFILIAVVCLFPLELSAQQLRAVFKEWTIPTAVSEPLSVVPVDEHLVYFTERLGGKIASLNTRTNNILEWSLPGSLPHDIISSGENALIFCEQADKIGMLNPRSNLVTEWALSPNTTPYHIEQVGQSVYFTERISNGIGKLNLNTNQLTQWIAPNSLPNGIAVDDRNQTKIWFAELPGKIGLLDTVANTIREWSLPTGGNPEHLKVVYGKAYYVNLAANTIGRIDTVTNIITEWMPPTASGGPEGLDVRGSQIYFTESTGSKIGLLNTITAFNVMTHVVPTTFAAPPATSLITRSQKTVTPTATTVNPVRTLVTGTTSNGFIEWQVPTAGSGPTGIARVPENGFVFSERFMSKIGLFTRNEEDDDD